MLRNFSDAFKPFSIDLAYGEKHVQVLLCLENTFYLDFSDCFSQLF